MQSATDSSEGRSNTDWDIVRAATYSWTFEELSHYSNCRVSPYVIAVARTLCSQFNISAKATRELERLRQESNASAEDSSDHVLRSLQASDGGLIVFGICGILNQYFHWMALADFFETLSEMSDMPQSLRPARGRWVELARIAGKIQSPASFDTLVQKYSQLGLADEAGANELEQCVGPRGVTECMQGMSRLRSGEDKGRIIMFCGRDAGWHAAIAEWVFDLRIKLTILDGKTLEGTALYSNCQDDQVQLTVAFSNPGVPCDGEPLDDPPMPTKDRGGDSRGNSKGAS